MRKFLFSLFVITQTVSIYSESPLSIGVISERDKGHTLAKWEPTANYLNSQLTGYDVTITPLSYDEVEESITLKRISFLICDPALYIDLSYRFDMGPIASIDDRSKGATLEMGSLLFVKSDRQNINFLNDMNRPSFAALDRRSLGGWIALQRELNKQSRRVIEKNTVFFESYDDIISAVYKGDVDGGIVASGVLEEITSMGPLNMEDFKVIPLRTTSDRQEQEFPYLVSTQLYPQWPLVKLAHTSPDIAEQVSSLLLTKREGKIRWTTPLNYQEVHGCLFDLSLGPYAVQNRIKLPEVIKEYLVAIIITLLTIFFLLTVLFYILHLNKLLKKRERELKNLVSQDTLTGLPNRRMFQDYSERTLELCRRRGCRMGLYYLDLDDFQRINNEMGYDVGDNLLKEVGERLNRQMRKSDLCARLGGDEFVSLIQDVKHDKGFDTVAKRIISELSQPYYINGIKIATRINVGISFFPDQGGDFHELMNKAHKALHLSKEAGTGIYKVFSE